MSVPADNPILHARDDALGRAALAQSFARQVRDVRRCQIAVRGTLDQLEDQIGLVDDPAVTLAALLSAKTENRSQMIGTRAVHRTVVLAWDTLVEIYGGEDILIARSEALKAFCGRRRRGRRVRAW